MDKLIPYDNKQLQKVGNAIAVTNKLLNINSKELITKLFLKDPHFFAIVICKFYVKNLADLKKIKPLLNSYIISNVNFP